MPELFTTLAELTAFASQHILDRLHEQKRRIRAQLEALDIACEAETANLAQLVQREEVRAARIARKLENARIKRLEVLEQARQERLAAAQEAAAQAEAQRQQRLFEAERWAKQRKNLIQAYYETLRDDRKRHRPENFPPWWTDDNPDIKGFNLGEIRDAARHLIALDIKAGILPEQFVPILDC